MSHEPWGDEMDIELAGYLTPVPDEIDAVDLPVIGALPRDLAGRYLRNGPNPLPGREMAHGFAGYGMIHGIRLRDGRAEWYRNRWVRTSFLAGASPLRSDGSRDLAAVSANTHVIEHAGRLLALVESGLPYELTAELDTVGPCDFAGRLTTAMTAHPKQDPETGELHFFGYGLRPPFLTYHRLAATGELDRSVAVDVPGPTMMHDFAITRNHVVWLDLPVALDPALTGRMLPFRWDDTYGARIGVMAREGDTTVRWSEVEPCYVFHVGNAYEDEAGDIVLDAVRYDHNAWNQTWAAVGGVAAAASSAGVRSLSRWTLNPRNGTVSEQRVDDRGLEFPTVDDRRVGRVNDYLYAVTGHTVVKFYSRTGVVRTHDVGADHVVGEAVFVPAAEVCGEDEGWLLSIVTDRAGRSSKLLVLDATDLTPVASVRLPRRVPAGFHGSWIPDAD